MLWSDLQIPPMGINVIHGIWMTFKRNSPMTKLVSFAAVLVLVFVGAAFAGSRIDPSVDDGPGHGGGMETMAVDSHGGEAAHGGGQASAAVLPGLSVAGGGYVLEVNRTDLPAGQPVDLDFSITTGEGQKVEEFGLTHERRMHLILVRRDFQGFQHLHPDQKTDGSWSVKSEPLVPGTYRMFADFSVGGEALTLASDLFVAGEFAPQPAGHEGGGH